jgi:hypothetical protein
MTTMSKRRSQNPAKIGFFERLLFRFMGPPQLGDLNAPSSVAADPTADLCHRCGQAWDLHERIHTGSMTYRKCPSLQR